MRITKYNINEFIEGTIMNCSDKGITHIEYIPDGITDLYCYNNKLTQLLTMGDSYGIPKLPDSLKSLHCGGNELYSLPKLPDSLIELSCLYNKLTKLPKLPNSLNFLDCSGNKLTEIPILPENLEHLNCYDNKLTSLPKLPESLERLNCRYNNLPYEITLDNYKEKHNKLIKRKEIITKICG